MAGKSLQRDFVNESASLLRQWCGESTIPTCDVTRLVEWAVVAVLRGSAAHALRSAACRRGSEIEAEARSCLGELFATSGPDSTLAVALDDPPPVEDAALVAGFCAVVNRTVRQRLFKQWRDDDPAAFKLWRLLRTMLHTDPRVLIFPADEPEWATAVRDRDLNPSGRPATEDIVLGHVLELSSRRLPLADLVVEVLGRIAATPDSCHAVRIDTLFAALREASRRETETASSYDDGSSGIDPFLRLAIDRSKDVATREVETILRRYGEQGKFDGATAAVFRDAAGELLDDYAASGIWPDAYAEYLQRHWPHGANLSYSGQLKARFEYIAKVARQAFEAAMRKEYGPS